MSTAGLIHLEANAATTGARRGYRPASPIPDAYRDFPIIVHCHLCWDWVWQRPQQFMSRLARRHDVLFVETHAPSHELAEPTLSTRSVGNHIIVAKVQFPCARWEDGDYVDRERRRLVQELLAGPVGSRFRGAVQWFYDPMAVVAFAGHLGEAANVYDCMDELSQFKGAPPGILPRERRLLALADVVFTGGRRLYESKRSWNPNCHFFGCGVEVDHFGKAMDSRAPIAADLQEIPGPRLGYIGVIDERIDYDLLAHLADARPNWSIVMVGPTAKVDPSHLPKRPNLHWLGARDYSVLPDHIRGFSACLMPFALNPATEFINPTKALEYLASGRPVISTAVADVVSNFSEAVDVARSPAEFVDACHRAVTSPCPARIGAGLEMAISNTWDSILRRMEKHIRDVLPRTPEYDPERQRRTQAVAVPPAPVLAAWAATASPSAS